MARKNDVTADTIFDTLGIVENQSCDLPVLPNELAGHIDCQLLNTAAAHD